MSIEVIPPTCGPVIIGGEENSIIRIWLRGKKPLIANDKIHVYGVVKLNDITEVVELTENNDWISVVEFDNLDSIESYKYSAGYYYSHEYDIIIGLDWSNIKVNYFDLNLNKPLSFVFGSCRRLMNIGPINLFGTGAEGDKIYRSILNTDPDLFLSIGDQVYFDAMNMDFLRCKTVKSMSKLYRKTYNFKHHRILCSSVPVYRTPDDHDRHMNNCNLETKERDPIGFANADRAYQLYQHHLGPDSNYIEYNEIWRDVNIYKLHHRDTTFFIMDCRSDRNEIHYIDSINNFKTIISFRQIKDFEKWIEEHRDNNEIVKFVVTSVPLLSQNTNDSWYGFPEQQKKIIDLILSVKNIFVLTGDAHCCRSGTYSIYNYEDKYLGEITEILSSGLVAINHDRGKPFNENIATEEYINEYDRNNDFPYIVDNSINKKGYKMVTNYATPCYPRPNKAHGINVIKQLFCRVVDNTFIKIKVLDNNIEVEIFNQDGRSLHLNRYELY